MAIEGKSLKQMLALLLFSTIVSLCHARSQTPCEVVEGGKAGPLISCVAIANFTTIISYLEQVDFVPANLHISSSPGLVLTKEGFQNPAFDNLQHLGLYNNGITELNPEVLTGLPKLHTLYISYNNITSIDETTFAGMNLTVMVLLGNHIANISEGAFRNLPHLTHLALEESKLTELPPTLFQGLTDLETLSLRENHFTSLDENIFLGLTNLTKLNLSENNITSLNSKTFQPLIALTKLYLSYNHLESLESNIFESNTNLTKLDLSHNKLSNLKNFHLTSSSLLELNIEDKAIQEYPRVY